MIIKTKKELEEIFKALYDQGFGYFRDYDAHSAKIDKIINSANTRNLSEYKYNNLKDRLTKMNDYEEIKKEAEKHFSAYSPEDKIKELMNKFYLIPNASQRTPSDSRPSDLDIIGWQKFKMKYNIDDSGYGDYTHFGYYNLDKGLRIRWSNDYEFPTLCELVNGGPPDFEIKKVSDGVELKGNLGNFKERYFNSLKSDNANEIRIIDYNNKRYIFNKE